MLGVKRFDISLLAVPPLYVYTDKNQLAVDRHCMYTHDLKISKAEEILPDSLIVGKNKRTCNVTGSSYEACCDVFSCF